MVRDELITRSSSRSSEYPSWAAAEERGLAMNRLKRQERVEDLNGRE